MSKQNQTGPPPGEWNGWPFDFSDFPHDDYGPALNYGVWLLTGLAAVFLGLRVFCKYLRRRGLWWDDYVLMASWVCVHSELPLKTGQASRSKAANKMNRSAW